MSSNLTIEELLHRSKVDIKKSDVSIKTLDYYTQNFFDRNTIVPGISLGESSRHDQEAIEKKQEMTAKQQEYIFKQKN